MRLGLLGPVDVRVAGRPLPMGGARERCVLALLLLGADRLTPTDRLIDTLWDDPPATARAQVHNLVSSLRRRLGAVTEDEMIVTRSLGYELRLGEHELDVPEFRRLVQRGRRIAANGDHTTATDLLDEALAQWRGPALADLPDDLVHDLRPPLEDERVAAGESLLDAQVTTGRYEAALALATDLHADHPYREGVYLARMLSLAGLGRRAEALAVYQDAYRRLVDDLGVEPGRSLHDAHQQILAGQDPTPTSAAGRTVPRQLPPITSALTGRDKLVGALRDELARAAEDENPVVLVVGPGGIGKTTAAVAAAHGLAETFPDGQLYADLRGSHADLAEPHAVAGRLLRALGVDPARVPDDPDERIATYRSHLAGRHILVMLDDAASEEQVRPLLPGTGGCGVLVTSRAHLGALVGTTRVSAPTLPAADAAALLARLIGAERAAAEPDAVAAVVERCGGLPLAVCVAGARLAVRPAWSVEEFERRMVGERRRLDELRVGDLNVRASIGLSYEALEPDTRRLCRRLGSVAAPDWPAWVATELLDRPDTDGPDAESMLDELVDVHLVEPVGRDAVGQTRFRMHDLVAEYARERGLAEENESERTGAIDRVLSGWLALATEADQHLGHGTPWADGLDGGALPSTAIVPGPETASEWFETERTSLVSAVSQAGRFGRAELAGMLALRLAGFLSMGGYDDDWERTLQTARACVRDRGTDRLLGQVLNSLFAVRLHRYPRADLADVTSEWLTVAGRLDDDPILARALTRSGVVARNHGHLAEAGDWFGQAVLTARRSGDLAALAGALEGEATVHLEAGRFDAALPPAAEATDIQRRVGTRRMIAVYLQTYGIALLHNGRLQEADAVLTEATELAREVGDDRWTAYIEGVLAEVDLHLGRWPEAKRRLEHSLQLHEAAGTLSGVAEVQRNLGELAIAQHRPVEAVERLTQSLEIWRATDARLEIARVLARLEIARRAVGDVLAADQCHEEWRAILADHDLADTCLRLPPFVTA
jgi:DNA-binding SARP family transcriptional activator